MKFSEIISSIAAINPVVTIINPVVTLIASVGTFVTALIILYQVIVAKRAIGLQSYLGLENVKEKASMREGIYVLRLLPTYKDELKGELQEKLKKKGLETKMGNYLEKFLKTDLEKFMKAAPSDVQNTMKEIFEEKFTEYKAKNPGKERLIYETVFFLNLIAHLVNEGYMDRYQAWGRYFHDYWLCYEKLYPWYTHGLRVTRYRDEKKYTQHLSACVFWSIRQIKQHRSKKSF